MDHETKTTLSVLKASTHKKKTTHPNIFLVNLDINQPELLSDVLFHGNIVGKPPPSWWLWDFCPKTGCLLAAKRTSKRTVQLQSNGHLYIYMGI